MQKFILFLMVFGFVYANQTVTNSRNVITTPPPEATKEGYKVIKRVYRVVETNSSATKEEKITKPKYNYFVGIGAGIISRERSVVVESKNSGDTIDLNGRRVVADGTNYSMTKSENEAVPEVEVGISSTDLIFYGAKVTLYKDFTELALFSGARFKNASLWDFTPYLQGVAGIGYDKAKTITPDNLTVGVFGGVEKFIKDDFLSINILLSYQHRYWQKIEMSYGDEYWRDNEIGAKIAVRYAF